MLRVTFALIGFLVTASASAQDASGPGPPASADSLTLRAVIQWAVQEAVEVQVARQQVRGAEGALTAVRGAFDVRGSAGASSSREAGSLTAGGGEVASLERTETRVGLTVPTRWGAEVRPAWTVQQTHLDAAGMLPTTVGWAGVEVAVPLLEGRGAAGRRALERAASFRVGAAGHDLQAERARTVLRVTLGYWELRAAQKRRAIAQASEARMQRLVEETRRLVDADERPAADLVQLRAELDDRAAERWAAEDALQDARRRLADLAGLDVPADSLAADGGLGWTAVTPEPRLPPPALDAAREAESGAADRVPLPPVPVLVEWAMQCRGELRAEQQRSRSVQADGQAAADAARPRLDLRVDAGVLGATSSARGGWGGWWEGWAPWQADAGGPSLTVALSTDLSLQGRAERGAVARTQAARREQALRLADARRSVRLSVATAVQSLRSRRAQLRAARAAARRYARVLANEGTKYRLGTGTLFDVILAEDRRTRSLRQVAAAQLAHAAAVTRLRFETGTLEAGTATRLPAGEERCAR
jgi:outer membrane protein TolC